MGYVFKIFLLTVDMHMQPTGLWKLQPCFLCVEFVCEDYLFLLHHNLQFPADLKLQKNAFNQCNGLRSLIDHYKIEVEYVYVISQFHSIKRFIIVYEGGELLRSYTARRNFLIQLAPFMSDRV